VVVANGKLQPRVLVHVGTQLTGVVERLLTARPDRCPPLRVTPRPASYSALRREASLATTVPE